MMANLPNLADPAYLLNEQYRDATNLNARIALHERFSTSKVHWHPWVFDHLPLPAQARVLELGAGPGRLWAENLDRVPPGWQVTVSDLSPGMLAETRASLAGHDQFDFRQVDAQAIPFPGGTFDAVIANHMLYHVPNRPQALAEIRRVLKPDGMLYATTVGVSHLQELNALIRRWFPALPERDTPFTLENGRAQLAPLFSRISVTEFDDALAVTEAAPLVAYIRSMSVGGRVTDDIAAEMSEVITVEIERRGAFHITKSSGLFVAQP